LCFLDNHYDLFSGIDKPQVCRNYKHEISFTHALRLREQPGETRLGHMMGDWTFFSNYGHVLVCLAKNQDARLRDVAAEVGITERAVQKIVRDLQEASFLSVSKHGRRNRYRINRRKALRHGLESHCTVGKLLSLIVKQGRSQADAEAHEEKVESVAVVTEKVKKSAPERPAEPAATNKPVDTRQQGSLF
jgi:Mn-dependent DtxR family transcriptional regulator